MMVSDFFNYVALTYNTVFHQVAANVPSSAGISSTFLPRQAVFPGPWEEYIKAPSNKSHIRPQKIWYVEGHVSMPEAVLDWQQGNSSTTLDPGGLVILEFPENIAGR